MFSSILWVGCLFLSMVAIEAQHAATNGFAIRNAPSQWELQQVNLHTAVEGAPWSGNNAVYYHSGWIPKNNLVTFIETNLRFTFFNITTVDSKHNIDSKATIPASWDTALLNQTSNFFYLLQYGVSQGHFQPILVDVSLSTGKKGSLHVPLQPTITFSNVYSALDARRGIYYTLGIVVSQNSKSSESGKNKQQSPPLEGSNESICDENGCAYLVAIDIRSQTVISSIRLDTISQNMNWMSGGEFDAIVYDQFNDRLLLVGMPGDGNSYQTSVIDTQTGVFTTDLIFPSSLGIYFNTWNSDDLSGMIYFVVQTRNGKFKILSYSTKTKSYTISPENENKYDNKSYLVQTLILQHPH